MGTLLFFYVPGKAQDVVKVTLDSASKKGIAKTLADTLKKVKAEKNKQLFRQAFGLSPLQPANVPAVAFMRAVVPSMGQFTNKQYWKMPIVLAAGAGGIGSIVFNGSRFRYYQEQAKTFTTSSETKQIYTVLGPTLSPFQLRVNARRKDIEGNYLNLNTKAITISQSQLVTAAEGYRRYRDQSFIFFSVGYLVSGIEAYVAAHLRSFDMSDDISLHFKPQIQQTAWGTPTYNVAFTINFK